MTWFPGSGCGLVVSPVFKTGVTRLRRVWWVRFPHSPATVLRTVVLAVLVTTVASSGLAAQIDTTLPPAPVQVDTVTEPGTLSAKPPVSPRRAFIRSLLVPGRAQMELGRPSAAGLFALVEIGAFAMLRRSALNLRQAKRASADSVVAEYRRDPLTGVPLLDPEGQPIPESWRRNGLGDRVGARKTHYEDWLAVLIFNHLFAAADAYVAAHLWDFPATVAAGVTRERQASITASFAW